MKCGYQLIGSLSIKSGVEFECDSACPIKAQFYSAQDLFMLKRERIKG